MSQSHYYSPSYCTPARMASFGYQIQEACKTAPESVLEIGIGSGVVTSALRRIVKKVVTLDIDPQLAPDICGSALDLPFCNNSFDTILCCEVLEHLPFNCFRPVLSELRRVCRRHVVISLPDVTRYYMIRIKLPRLSLDKSLSFPYGPPSEPVPGIEHFWEIGRVHYPLSLIEDEMKRSFLDIGHTFRVPENYYHRIFVLSKIDGADDDRPDIQGV
jgi:ubiquinone/menaquinone biosynthesis C-methylase UbiE